MASERVVVTGIGAISPNGIGKDQFWQNTISGKSGIKPITSVPVELQSACKIAGEIPDFDPNLYMDPKSVRRTDRFIQFAIAASKALRFAAPTNCAKSSVV